jgi:hypothetical protein
MSNFLDLELISSSNATDDESTIWVTFPLSISWNSMVDDCTSGVSEGTLRVEEFDELEVSGENRAHRAPFERNSLAGRFRF